MFRFVSSVFVLAGGLCFLAGADLLSGTRAMRWIGDRVAMLTGSPIGDRKSVV